MMFQVKIERLDYEFMIMMSLFDTAISNPTACPRISGQPGSVGVCQRYVHALDPACSVRVYGGGATQ